MNIEYGFLPSIPWLGGDEKERRGSRKFSKASLGNKGRGKKEAKKKKLPQF
jgi:hypothetical protein